MPREKCTETCFGKTNKNGASQSSPPANSARPADIASLINSLLWTIFRQAIFFLVTKNKWNDKWTSGFSQLCCLTSICQETIIIWPRILCHYLLSRGSHSWRKRGLFLLSLRKLCSPPKRGHFSHIVKSLGISSRWSQISSVKSLFGLRVLGSFGFGFGPVSSYLSGSINPSAKEDFGLIPWKNWGCSKHFWSDIRE